MITSVFADAPIGFLSSFLSQALSVRPLHSGWKFDMAPQGYIVCMYLCTKVSTMSKRVEVFVAVAVCWAGHKFGLGGLESIPPCHMADTILLE